MENPKKQRKQKKLMMVKPKVESNDNEITSDYITRLKYSIKDDINGLSTSFNQISETISALSIELTPEKLAENEILNEKIKELKNASQNAKRIKSELKDAEAQLKTLEKLI